MEPRYEIEVVVEEGVLVMPRPSSWMAGMARHAVVTRVTGMRANIASPDRWEDLRRTRQTLRIYADGSWTLT